MAQASIPEPATALARSDARAVWIALGLVLAVFALYWPVGQHDFVGYDDVDYVTGNPHIAKGLDGAEIGWVFTHAYAANYHPLTWLSHMLDVELFGLAPGPHHLMSVGLHALDAVLVFFLCRALLGGLWSAAFAAALFALHPLRVESVAWASERKDLLCAAFTLGALLLYLRYARAPALGRYLLVVLAFVLALLAKPMAVTFPCAALLLDVWPLERLERTRPWRAVRRADGKAERGVWLEKLPLFALAGLGAWTTWFAQQSGGAIGSQAVPAELRCWNALAAYGAYLRQSFWPTHLAVFYPHAALVVPDPRAALVGPALLAALVLALGAVLAWRARARWPWLLVGWCWFLGLLVPVLGLVQVGSQSHADRYTYLPLIGVGWCVAGLARACVAARPALRGVVVSASLLALAACALLSAHQIPVWKDGETLYTHALEVTEQNFVAHTNLGALYLERENFAAAEEHLRAALRIRPDLHVAHNNLGLLLARTERLEEACKELEAAIEVEPHYAEAHNNLAVTLYRLGRQREAAEHYRRALEFGPPAPNIVNNLALLLATSTDSSVRDGAEAVRLAELAVQASGGNPRYVETLAAAYAERGDFEAAVRFQRQAIDALPNDEKERARARLELYEKREPWRR